MRPLVLASTSPLSAALLERLGLPFTTVAPNADESRASWRDARANRAPARRGQSAQRRGSAPRVPSSSARTRSPTATASRSASPADHDSARAMLTRSPGRTVVFHTGIALLDTASGAARRRWSTCAAPFAGLRADEIDAYLEREQPYDCAGAVKSEGLGIALFEAIESDDPTALIGLPLIRSPRCCATPACPCSRRDDAIDAHSMAGTLYLVPNLLGLVPPEHVLPAQTIAIARRLDHFIVENAKPARAFLKSLDPARPMREIAMPELGADPSAARLRRSCSPRRARVTTSGSCRTPAAPAIADPGAQVVAAAHRERHRRRAAGRTVVGPARADGLRDERPGIRVSRLPAGEAARPRGGAARARSGLAAHGPRAALHRDAVSERGAPGAHRRHAASRRRGCASPPI